MVVVNFYVLDRKYLFWANVVLKIKIICLKGGICYLNYFEYVKLNDDVHFFCFTSFLASLTQNLPTVYSQKVKANRFPCFS